MSIYRRRLTVLVVWVGAALWVLFNNHAALKTPRRRSSPFIFRPHPAATTTTNYLHRRATRRWRDGRLADDAAGRLSVTFIPPQTDSEEKVERVQGAKDYMK